MCLARALWCDLCFQVALAPSFTRAGPAVSGQEEAARHPHHPSHTVGAVAAVHTGYLAVHAGCPGLAGGGAAGDALVVDKGLLLAAHRLEGREQYGLTAPFWPQLCQDRPRPHPKPWGRGWEGFDFPDSPSPSGSTR